jgi:hypothetical protein
MRSSAAASSIDTFPAREANNSDIHLDVNRREAIRLLQRDPLLLARTSRLAPSLDGRPRDLACAARAQSVLIVGHTALAVVSGGGIAGGKDPCAIFEICC